MTSNTGFRFYPLPANVLIAVLAITSVGSANPGLSLLSLAVLVVLPKLVWLKGHPPLIVICLIFQWLQICTKLFQANLDGSDFIEYAGSYEAQRALLSALGAMLVLSLGIRLMIGAKKNVQITYAPVAMVDTNRILRVYFFFFGAAFAISGILYLIPGLTQILLSLTYIKWVFYVLVFYFVLIKKEKYYLLPAIFSLEFIYNSFGYYSNFKDVIFVSCIALFTIVVRVRPVLVILLAPLFYLFFNIFVIWNDIKGDYRDFLDNNKDITFSQRVDKISELYEHFTDFDLALEVAMDRLSYLTMFMYTIETVPQKVPHENGELWLGAIQNVTMPRFLFPDKPVLHDSEKANAYTGREWAGAEQGTSISIGYISESYVDFGFTVMYVPIFLLGLVIGFMYRNILSYRYPAVVLFALVIPVIYFTKFNLIETSNGKLLGSLVMNFLVLSLFIRYGMPMVLKYLKPVDRFRESPPRHSVV